MIVFFGRFRSAVVAVVALPVAVLSFLPIYAHGFTLNIMSSVGCGDWRHGRCRDRPHRQHLQARRGRTTRSDYIRHAGSGSFCLCVSDHPVGVFPTLLFLEGMEGRLFRPLALTKTCGLSGACVAVILVPALSILLLKHSRHKANGLRIASMAHGKTLFTRGRRCAQRPWVPIVMACLGMGLTLAVAVASTLNLCLH